MSDPIEADPIEANPVEANPISDRYFDLSLRLLTIFVLVSLACCVAFLTYRWVYPRLRHTPQAPVELRSPVVVSPAPASQSTPAPADQVLMDPHQAFRCVEQGKVTFSDRACDSGSVQTLPLAPAQPAAGR
jgi:hypothetical protein